MGNVACLPCAAQEPQKSSFLVGKTKSGTSVVGAEAAWCESSLGPLSYRPGDKVFPAMERVSVMIEL